MNLKIAIAALLGVSTLAACSSVTLPRTANLNLMSDTVRPGISDMQNAEAALESTGTSDQASMSETIASRETLGAQALKVAKESAEDAVLAAGEAAYMKIDSHNLAAEAALDAELLLITDAGTATLAAEMPEGGVRFANAQLNAAALLCDDQNAVTADDIQRCSKTVLLMDRARIEPPHEALAPQLQVTRRVLIAGNEAASALPDTATWQAISADAAQLEAAFGGTQPAAGGAPTAVLRWTQMQPWVCNVATGKASLATRISSPTAEQRAAANTAIQSVDSAIIAGALAMDSLAAAADGAEGVKRLSASAETVESCTDEACVRNRNLAVIEGHCRGLVEGGGSSS